MTTLLDGNVLIALLVVDHVHHDDAERWWASRQGAGFATTPSTQGTLVRFLLRGGMTASDACAVLDAFVATPGHEFWPDSIAYDAQMLRGVIGHRQVTDAYLAAQARERDGRLATFDQGLASTHRDVTELLAHGR